MFTEILRTALDRVDGAVACVLMGFDGIAVDVAVRRGEELPAAPQDLATEYHAHLQSLRKTTEETGQGALEETAFRTERLQGVAHLVDENYFLLLLLKPGAMLGKGRYLLKVLAPKVRAEL